MNPELALFFSKPEINQMLCAQSLIAAKKHVQNKVLVLDGISAGLVGSFNIEEQPLEGLVLLCFDWI